MLLLADTVPRFQVIVLPTGAPPSGLAITATPKGRVSVSTTPVASASPLFVIVKVYVIVLDITTLTSVLLSNAGEPLLAVTVALLVSDMVT